MKLVSIQCPQCKAPLDIGENRKECFCSYCGNKIILDDGSRTYTHVYMNRTREKELELEQKKLEEEKARNIAREQTRKKLLITVCVALAFVLLTFLFVKNDFNIMFNFCLMLVGSGTAIARIIRKESDFGIAVSAAIIIVACIIFIVGRNDFDMTFTITLVLTVALHIVASIMRKTSNE